MGAMDKERAKMIAMATKRARERKFLAEGTAVLARVSPTLRDKLLAIRRGSSFLARERKMGYRGN